MRRRVQLICVTVLLMVSAALLISCGESSTAEEEGAASAESPPTKATIRLSYLWAAHHAPLILAQERGYFRDENLEVDIREGQGSLSTAQLIGAGRGGDIGYIDLATMARAVGEGVPIKAIYGVMQQNPLALVFQADSGIATVDDLPGKRFMLVTGGAETVMVPAFLAAQGISEDEVKSILVQPGTDTLASLLTGKTDVIFSFKTDGWAGYRAEQEGATVDSFSFVDYGLQALNHGFIANDDTLEERPELVRGVLAAVTRGWEAAIEDPQAAVDALVKAHPDLNPEQMLVELENTIETLHTDATEGEPLGVMGEADWESTVDLLHRYGGMEERLPLPDYFTNEFIAGG